MALFRSLYCSSKFARPSPLFRNPLIHARCVVLKTSPAKPEEKLDHNEKNELLNRPMSPHLTIYAPQLTSLMSLSHRTSGIILAGYAIVIAGASFTSFDIPHVVSFIQGLNVPSAITFIFKFGLATPACYHLLNGLRHLSWDMGLGLTLKEVYLTGYVTIALTFLLALYLAAR